MSNFLDVFKQSDWATVQDLIASRASIDVEKALSKKSGLSLEDFAALLSPPASEKLERMAQKSVRLTRQRFGNTMQLYAPLYLSNECQNICNYCGFSLNNPIERKTLSEAEINAEALSLKALGFHHLLVVTGEAKSKVGMPYFEKALTVLRRHFDQISFEVQPLETDDYSRLRHFGVDAVLVYQETYNKEAYQRWHPKGQKSKMDYRLLTPDRLGLARMPKIGLGVLLGLADWRVDAWFTAMHLAYLRKRYWSTKFSISFPRLRPAEGVEGPEVEVTDRDLVQLITAFRMFDPDLELSLSTRESARFRDNVSKLGITTMSAESRTTPGGYAAGESKALAQFDTSDQRPVSAVAEVLMQQGLEPVWKDWEPCYGRA